MANDVLFVVVSWEERCPAGVERSMATGTFSRVVCLVGRRFLSETEASRKRIRAVVEGAGAAYEQHVLDLDDQIETLTTLEGIATRDLVGMAERLVVDVSTAPRAVVWILLTLVGKMRPGATVRYTQAATYADWHKRDDGDPKLIANRSGVVFPDLPTCLVLLCGPEISRADMLCWRFEPKKAIVLRDPLADRFGDVRGLSSDFHDIAVERTFDNKDPSDANLDVLENLIRPYMGTHNVVAASLGPKLGGLVLFRMTERHPDIALCYIASGRYNLDVTGGIGATTDLEVTFERR